MWCFYLSEYNNILREVLHNFCQKFLSDLT
nr:MAG TPA: hypothetical protein [Caudoviricetes sp.]